MKVWILTSEYNDYNQYGEYFEGVFLSKPTIEQLVKKEISVEVATRLLTKFGGRLNSENTWYYLREYEVQP